MHPESDPARPPAQSIASATVIPAPPFVIPAKAGTLPHQQRAAPRHPHIFLCTDCEAEHHSPDHHVPVGWSQQGPDIRCPDCTASYGRKAGQ
jgi:DNA-directed RNA polymerase subunit RPC12/RpoP